MSRARPRGSRTSVRAETRSFALASLTSRSTTLAGSRRSPGGEGRGPARTPRSTSWPLTATIGIASWSARSSSPRRRQRSSPAPRSRSQGPLVRLGAQQAAHAPAMDAALAGPQPPAACSDRRSRVACQVGHCGDSGRAVAVHRMRAHMTDQGCACLRNAALVATPSEDWSRLQWRENFPGWRFSWSRYCNR